MIRLENMLPKALLTGVLKMVDLDGPEKTLKWLEDIGKDLAEIEGAGFEGGRDDNILYLPICPFGGELIEFIEIYGEQPAQFKQVIEVSDKKRDNSDNPWDYPALSNILGVLHYSYVKRRAEMAGFKIFNLGCRSPMKDYDYIAYNEQAIEKVNMTREEVDKYLEKAYCVFKIEPANTE
ncbi:conserved hypothetical protein [Methanohalobium evestigatum Z-7303]|uniref:Uncharacterized protein n=1 Tax=Methanohalobium evestigatum (strain ATCC BAA-1072 / DSM 3721 / NBRC 107634 / OCM 161 / Z-7303) TaxID=644295 RepID=D7E647_METEZ|nr:hypothetical protein [Methanohalobium evestigatum]ADI73069.1 conserved hypothetical protein [Methanohalobium evestigatum Z-7303]